MTGSTLEKEGSIPALTVELWGWKETYGTNSPLRWNRSGPFAARIAQFAVSDKRE
jgi:hypothetical protein